MHQSNFFLQGEVGHNGLPQWLAEQIGLYGNEPESVQLVIWINSNGGDVLAAIEAINLMRSSPIPVVTIINGCAESAALLVAMAGHRRFAFNNAWGMAHHFSTGMEGSYHDLMDSLKHNDILHLTMTNLFKAYSTASANDIDTILLGRMTSWLTADDLLGYGLIDEIIDPGEGLRERVLGNVAKSKNEGLKVKKQAKTKKQV